MVVAESCDRARVIGVGRANFMQLPKLWASVTCGLGVVPLTPVLAPESRGVGARGAHWRGSKSETEHRADLRTDFRGDSSATEEFSWRVLVIL